MRPVTRSVFRTMNGTLGRNLIIATRSSGMDQRNPSATRGLMSGYREYTRVERWKRWRQTMLWASWPRTERRKTQSWSATTKICGKSRDDFTFHAAGNSLPSRLKMAIGTTCTKLWWAIGSITTRGARGSGKYGLQRLSTISMWRTSGLPSWAYILELNRLLKTQCIKRDLQRSFSTQTT